MTTPNGEIPEGGRGYEDVSGLANAQPPAMANPDLWNAAEAARGNFFGNILSGFVSVGMAIGQALEDLADAFLGDYDGSNASLGAIRDGQLDLRNSLDALRDVSGYAAAYMPVNPFESRGVWLTAPFTASMLADPVTGEPIGKNATVNGDGTITLEKGTWTIFAKVSWDQHDSGRTSVAIEVLNPSGGVYSLSEYYGNVEQGQYSTAAFSHTVVCPDPGYKVRVRYYNQVPGIGLYWKLRWLGGTHRSQLSVSRWDLNTDGAVRDENPPDSGNSQGDG